MDAISISNCRKGDYFRYLAEFKNADQRKDAAEDSLLAYKVGIWLLIQFTICICHQNANGFVYLYVLQTASDIAMTDLAPTHPIR